MKAAIRIHRVTPEIVFIVDLHGARSITNDAEAVTTAVFAQFGPRRIIYRDTMGHWDELVHQDGVFCGFAAYRQEVGEEGPEQLAQRIAELVAADRSNAALALLRAIGDAEAQGQAIRLAIASGSLTGPQAIALLKHSIPLSDWPRLGIEPVSE